MRTRIVAALLLGLLAVAPAAEAKTKPKPAPKHKPAKKPVKPKAEQPESTTTTTHPALHAGDPSYPSCAELTRQRDEAEAQPPTDGHPDDMIWDGSTQRSIPSGEEAGYEKWRANNISAYNKDMEQENCPGAHPVA